jgi:ribonucleotide monophosphatase NagD (HAD superfamily)
MLAWVLLVSRCGGFTILDEPLFRFVTIAASFPAVFFDQYRVLHDGRNPYPGARDALAALKSRGVKIVILSNSGRMGEINAQRIATLGFGRTSTICSSPRAM